MAGSDGVHAFLRHIEEVVLVGNDHIASDGVLMLIIS